MTLQAHIQSAAAWRRRSRSIQDRRRSTPCSVAHYSDARHGWTGEDRETTLKKAAAHVEMGVGDRPSKSEAYRARAAYCCSSFGLRRRPPPRAKR